MKKLFPAFILLCFISACNPYVARSIFYNDPGIKDNKLMPVRLVKRGTIQPLSVSPEYNKKKIPDPLMKVLKATGTVAFLVMKDDSILTEWYARGYNDSSLTNPFSVTKSIVSILTGIALKEGKIKSLDEPICNYYEPYRKNGLNKITFKNLLCMSSGVNFNDAYLNPAGQTAQLYYGNNMHQLINSLSIDREPGSVFRYKNCDPEILTLALENAVGMNMSDYASEKFWKPVGAAHDAEWIIDKPVTGVEKSYCCFHSNARDMARLGLLYEQKGSWNGNQIVDSSYVKSSLTPHMLPRENGKTEAHNGYLWWLRNVDGMGDFCADGLKGQYISVIPSRNLIFVRLGKRDWLVRGKRFSKKKSEFLYEILLRSVVKVWG